MAEYIDRKAIREALYREDAITFAGMKILNQFPTADVVEQSKWIPVTERLPSENGLYFCCWKAQCDDKSWIIRLTDWRADTGWMNMYDEPMKELITHWMPLPEPPVEVNE